MEGFSTFMNLNISPLCTFLMFNKARLVGKSFPTPSVFIGSLSYMSSLMDNKLLFHDEGSPTFTTFMRFLSCVHFLMFNET